ncbi:CehA/McbA family metallohydrolase [Paenisporosarcina sp. NPDC076898]|uniref:CehA/McbA family metallohydrolase n=1 Tax=unclassified Paenisporosarcina TaxID=2642018 RepID=UPI003D086D9F
MIKRKQSLKRWVSMFLTAILVVSSMLPAGLSHKVNAQIAEQVVISQVYGGGGNGGAKYSNDFIELYNPTASDISLDGWSVQYASSTGSVSTGITGLTGEIKAYSYYLIKAKAGTSVTDKPLPEPYDVTSTTIDMAGTNGKVALVKDKTTAISGKDDPAVLDYVGYGSANAYEGSAATPVLTNSTAAIRRPYANMNPAKGYGNGWDTNDNKADFVAVAPVPHNSASPAEKFELVESLKPIGDRILFVQQGTNATIKALAGTVTAEATVKFYSSETIGTETYLGSTTATANGSFETTFDAKKVLTSVFITSTEVISPTENKPESLPTEIAVAAPSTSLDAEKLAYSVDGNGNGTVSGKAAAGKSSSSLAVYTSEAMGQENYLAPSNGEPVIVNGAGEFTYTFNGTTAPETVYVTQQTATAKGIQLQSVPVSVTKPDLTVITKLADVRGSDDKGQPIHLNESFTIEGVVTFENGVLGSQKSNFYLQDETAGINVFGSFDHNLTIERGDKLRVSGKVIYYNGLTEFEPTSIKKVLAQQELPAPKQLSILDMTNYAIAEPLEGSLAKVSGKVSAVTASGSNTNVTIVDENNKSTLVRVMAKTNINIEKDIVQNKSYTFTGVVSQYTTSATAKSGYQLFPRDVKDISPMLGITHTPITTTYLDTNVSFEAVVDGAESVTLSYKGTSDSEFTTIPMVGDTENRFTAQLAAGQVPQNGFEYKITATAGTQQQVAGPFTVTLVEDAEGPQFLSETPQNGTRVETPRPEVAVLIDDLSGVEPSSIQLWIDGEVKSDAVVSKTQVKYTATEDYAQGIHTVKVTAKDLKGNESTKEWTFEIVPRFTGGNHYRGTTHNHTNISHDGTGSPEDALKAGQKYGYDYFAFSDHSHDIDPDKLGTDTVDRKGMPERSGGSDWQLTKNLADQYTKDGEYVVFPAFEMTSTSWGHSNVFGTENFIDRNVNGKQYQSLDQYYAWVLSYEDVVAQFNHPDMSTNAFNSFKPYDQKVDQLFTMLEVGNGSGNYAYANAEKKYFSTLDLGWHLAPTYGEDNHDGTWGKTNARTVIVADDLTQASLLHSMRNMRVYMSEDANADLDVMANGYYMGSTVDSTSLDFEISVKDLVAETKSNGYDYLPTSYASNDVVEKVELITNGGKVVETHTPDAKDFTWKPSVNVPSGQQWFVVRVTQKDGERIYSAPIWSKEVSVDVKVNAIDVTGDVIIEGNPAKLNATVGNFGTQEVKNLKVDFYYDEVKAEKLIGTNTISSILSKGTGIASVTWATPIKGNHNIIAVVTSNDGLQIGDVSFTLPVIVKEPLGIKVVIDAAHGNENSSGDGGTYKDNLKAFTVLLQKEGYTVAENKAEITDATFTGVNVFMMTHPKTVLTASEQTAVAKFVQNGGSLLVAGKSNNSSEPTINNAVLAEAGSTIRIQSDGVFDLSKSGNFWSDPTVSPFAVRPHPGLVDNYMTDRVPFVDYYSGASLSGPQNTALNNSDKVTILVKGNETTYQGNLRSNAYAYDTVSDNEGGSKIPLIASEEIGEKGRVIVSGMNIFNDKQLDEAYEPKGNDEFSLNAINWLAHRDTTVTPINEARKVVSEKEVVVEGTVTAEAGIFFDAFYIQDETGGIMAFQEVPADALKLGDKVRIYGHIISFDNNIEIEFTSFAHDVIKIGHGDVVQPKQVATGDATTEANQGSLVKVKGQVTSIYDDNSYVINDGSGDVLVFTDGYIVNQSGAVPKLKVGDTLEAVGLSGSFAGGTRIRVRNTKELVGTEATIPDVKSIEVNKTDVSLEVGGTDQLVVTETTTKADSTSTQENVTPTATYSGFDTNVISVEAGLITAKAAGSTNITITVGENTKTVSVTVKEIPDVKTLEVDKTDVSLEVGATDQLVVTETTTKADSTSTQQNVTPIATYSGYDTNVISVEAGLITAKAAGSTNITITVGDNTKTVSVMVKEKPDVKTLEVDKTTVSLEVGATDQLVVTETTTKADSTSTQENVTPTATYSGYDTNVIAVEAGLITAKVAGSTNITITVGENTKTVSVTVTEKPDVKTLEVNKTSVSLSVGKTERLIVNEITTKANMTSTINNVTATATYSGFDSKIISINAGLITAKASGTTNIKITVGKNSKTVKVTVTEKAPPKQDVITIELNKSTMSLVVGATDRIVMTETIKNSGMTKSQKDVSAVATYSGYNANVISVNGGLVTAKAAGTTTIIATYGGNSVLINVTVIATDLNVVIVNAGEIDTTKSAILIESKTSFDNGKGQIRFTNEAVAKIDKANKNVIVKLASGTFTITSRNFDILAKKGTFSLNLEFHVQNGSKGWKMKDMSFTDATGQQITEGFKDFFIITTSGKKQIVGAYYENKSKKWRFLTIRW